MIKKFIFFLGIILLNPVFFSCKKTTGVDLNSKLSLLSNTTWMIEEVYLKDANNNIDGTIFIRNKTAIGSVFDYSKVRLTLFKNGKASAIDQSGNNISSANWELSSDETKIIISGTGDVFDGTGDLETVEKDLFIFSGIRSASSRSVFGRVRLIPAND